MHRSRKFRLNLWQKMQDSVSLQFMTLGTQPSGIPKRRGLDAWSAERHPSLLQDTCLHCVQATLQDRCPAHALKGPSTGLPTAQSLGGQRPIAHSSTEARLPHLSPAAMRASLRVQESGHWGRKALPSLPGPRGGRRPEGASSYAARCPASPQERAPCPLASRASVGSSPERRGPEASLPRPQARRWGWPGGGVGAPRSRWS